MGEYFEMEGRVALLQFTFIPKLCGNVCTCCSSLTTRQITEMCKKRVFWRYFRHFWAWLNNRFFQKMRQNVGFCSHWQNSYAIEISFIFKRSRSILTNEIIPNQYNYASTEKHLFLKCIYSCLRNAWKFIACKNC